MRKKTAMIISLAVGTLMFATTAFAEVVSKNGYDEAKDALKYSADSLTSKLSSYTVDTSFLTKDNGNTISSSNSVNKYNLKNNSCENTTTNVQGSDKFDSLYYRDNSGYINYSTYDGIYHVIEQKNIDNSFWIKNPFKEKQAGDIEKIADAFVGNLKDSVVVTQNSDGSKELSGSLSEAQIPSLVNAIVSYQLKLQYGAYGNNPNSKGVMPKITQDIIAREVKGKMTVDKDGLIQSILATAVLYGKDNEGKEHNLTFEVLAKVYDVNKTVVNKPDLSGKKVEKTTVENQNKLADPEMYIGTYKNSIIIKENGKFQKIGERVVDIEKIDDKNISGRYHEEYVKGYEDYAAKAKDFKFDAQFDKGQYNANFTYSNSDGKKLSGNIGMNFGLPKIYFSFENISNGNLMFDAEFNKVLD